MAEFCIIWIYKRLNSSNLLMVGGLCLFRAKPLNQLEILEQEGKVVVIYGPRRVGKTTLLKKYLEDKQDYLFVTGEDIFVHEFLSSNSVEKLKNFIGNKKRLVIDEAQCIPSIGKISSL